jgi:hypothetical protein
VIDDFDADAWHAVAKLSQIARDLTSEPRLTFAPFIAVGGFLGHDRDAHSAQGGGERATDIVAHQNDQRPFLDGSSQAGGGVASRRGPPLRGEHILDHVSIRVA